MLFYMISKTKVKERIKGKGNPEIVETINLAMKNEKWFEIAKIISSSRKKYSDINLKNIDEKTKEGDIVVVAGKVLGKGNISKKVRVCAINFSESAREKLRKTKSEAITILEEIKKNPKAEGIKLIR